MNRTMFKGIGQLSTSLRFLTTRTVPINVSSKVILPSLSSLNHNIRITDPNINKNIINPLGSGFVHNSIIQPESPTSILEKIPSHDQVEPQPLNEIFVDSVLRKRRLKMKKHKLRKRRRAQRALKKRLGKL